MSGFENRTESLTVNALFAILAETDTETPLPMTRFVTNKIYKPKGLHAGADRIVHWRRDPFLEPFGAPIDFRLSSVHAMERRIFLDVGFRIRDQLRQRLVVPIP